MNKEQQNMEKFEKQLPLIKVYGNMVIGDEVYQRLIFQQEVDGDISTSIYDVVKIIKDRLVIVNSKTFKLIPEKDVIKYMPAIKCACNFYELNWLETPEVFVKYSDEFYNVIQFKVEE